MTFDNQHTTYKIYFRKFLLALFIALFVIVVLVSGWFDDAVLGLEKYHYTIIAASVYVIITIFNYIIGYNYFYFSDDGDRILIRFYPIRPLVHKKRAIQIPKTSLAKYEIKTLFFGLKTILLLYQSIKNKTAKYPPISITSLTTKERELLEKLLAKYVR